MRDCPLCGCTLVDMGTEHIVMRDRIDAPSQRWDCPEGHSFLIVNIPDAIARHQADDPHCTCNDCMDDFTKGGE